MIEVRDRLTDGINRARLKLELRRAVGPLAVALVGAAIAVACAFYVLANVAQTVYRGSRQVGFTVSDASGVVGGGRQELEFKGIPAGVIKGVKLVNGRAVVEASLYSSFGPVYRNASATLRPATALQDMYVDILSRGTPSAGLASVSHPLPMSQTYTSVQPSAVLDTFNPDVRSHLQTLLTELGQGLSDRGAALNAAFVQVVPFLEQAANVTHQLAIRSQDTRALIRNVGTLTATLAQRQQDLRTLISKTGTTLQAVQASDPQLNATLEQLPPTLKGIDSSFAAVRGLLPTLNTTLVKLEPVADALPAGLRSLRTFSNTARPALARLQAPVQRLVPLSQNLKPVSRELLSAVNDLSPQVPDINHIVSAVAGCPTALQGFFQWTPSVTDMWGPDGPAVRGDFGVGLDETSVVQDPNTGPSPSCAAGQVAGGAPGPTLPGDN